MPHDLVPNQTIRAARRSDAGALAALFRACDEAEGAPDRVSTSDVEEDWQRPRFVLDRDTQLVFSDEDLVASGEVWERDPGAVHEVFCQVHPAWRGRGLGTLLIDWSETRVTAGRILNFVSGADEAAKALLRARGYHAIRHFWHMEIELEGSLEPADPPPGIRIKSVDGDRDARAVHAVVMEAFKHNWGYVFETFDEWWGAFENRSDYDAGLSFLAEDEDGRPLGALTGQTGEGYGWVRDLAVVPEGRGRGLGAALLKRSFATFAERGFPKVLLNVDAANETGATRLYERVGMKRIRQFDCYEKNVGS